MATHPAGSDESLSLWIDTTPATHYPSLHGNVEADVAIVGAGITGITAAYLLATAGQSVVLVDKGRMAMSETGHTTAHIIESTDADYGELIKVHGQEDARMNTEAIRSAMALIRSLVDELSIDCGFKAVDGYLYTEVEKDRQYLQRESENLRRAGVETEWIDEVPVPFATFGGLRFRDQFVFHVRRYLLGIVDAAVKHGVRIFENTLVSDVENGENGSRCVVKSEEGTIRARHVLLATHVPINDRGAVWAKMHVTRTYVVAGPVEPGDGHDVRHAGGDDAVGLCAGAGEPLREALRPEAHEGGAGDRERRHESDRDPEADDRKGDASRCGSEERGRGGGGGRKDRLRGRSKGRGVPHRRRAARGGSRVHAHGLHGGLERGGEELGLPLSRLALRHAGRGLERAGHDCAGAGGRAG